MKNYLILYRVEEGETPRKVVYQTSSLTKAVGLFRLYQGETLEILAVIDCDQLPTVLRECAHL